MTSSGRAAEGGDPSGQNEDWTGPVADSGEPRPATNRVTAFEGRIWSVISEDVDFGPVTARRDVLIHPGAVAVLALDDADRVLLIRQYRHPVGLHLFEPPAGLMDTADETGWQTAERELAEEAGYRAQDWHVLLDVYLSPGGMSEAIRIFLARGLTPIPGGRQHTGEAEEAHLPRVWVDLDEAEELVLGGSIGSPSAAAGILAAGAGRRRDWRTLRPASAPWTARERLLASGRVRLPQ
jgi:8-oxo-dGTP pyrophosphatase MutT (NUDIX family)